MDSWYQNDYLLVDFALLELQQFLIGQMVGRVLMLGVLRNRVVTR